MVSTLPVNVLTHAENSKKLEGAAPSKREFPGAAGRPPI